ncbi:hypothetical protein KJ781_02600 [Patescibacteria group bacterium]|nr:hypothetical protein [Patescibacteria group bacterium]MBU1448307.1 hypothetical protein [Patescibacteria group bacterium]MBU2613191.1 hypothetical protein [Patescibacteria group bacterium]
MNDKKVLLDGVFVPTTPPSASQPPSQRHPGCIHCQAIASMARVVTTSRYMEIDIDMAEQGTCIEFVCHGRYDPTRIIKMEVVLLDSPDVDDAPDGKVRPRQIDIISIAGAPEWADGRVALEMLCGAVKDGVTYHLGHSEASPVIRLGTFLLFRNEKGEGRTLKLPVAHIAVQR